MAARMAATLAHRGPDDSGTWADAARRRRRSASAASRSSTCRRKGHQPMTRPTAATRSCSTARSTTSRRSATSWKPPAGTLPWRLRHRGHAGGVRTWGVEAAIQRLWGMFALALWDAHERVLHLARDRLGKKPLYYGWQGDTLSVRLRAQGAARASALRAAHRPRRARRASCASPTCRPRGPSTRASASCRRAAPGASARIARASCAEPRRYWDPVAVARERPGGPAPALGRRGRRARSRRCWRDAVRLRSVADVPLGAFLSGGIDSSTVVALMQAQSSRRVPTFTIGFDAPDYDESSAARAVADHLAPTTPSSGHARRGAGGHPAAGHDLTTSRSPTRRRSRPSWSRELARRTSRSRSRATAATSCSAATTGT